MKAVLRFCGLCALFACLPAAWSQPSSPKVARVDIQHVGPAAVADELIRANIHLKPGDPYLPATVDDDVRNLYATGLFYNIRVTADPAGEALILTYVVQAMPRLTDIKLNGNKKLTDAKIKKKLTSKVGEPLNEQKLFSDAQAIQEMYQKSGYPGTSVQAVPNIAEESGRGTVTFEIKESRKIRIVRVEFIGAQAFSQHKLQKEIKTRAHWMWSWLTGSGTFKDDQFQEDRERLAEFYRTKGYIDFEIKDVQFENPTPASMIIRFTIYEGQPYKVGAVTFEGTTMLPTNAVAPHFNAGKLPQRGPDQRAWFDQREMNRAFVMKEGGTFTAKGLAKDVEAVEDFYGMKGHIDVEQGNGNLNVARIANTEKGTMDLRFKVEEGQKSSVEKIEIRGNVKTKDKVIRRELTISPGEAFNMVAVKRSKARLEGLQYFEKVDTRAEEMDPAIPGRKNLIVGVEEKNTGNLSVGAGFSSVDAVVGFAEITQGNFDLFHPPYFTGGGQKLRLRVQLGTQRQDYVLSFIEPWFLDRKLALGVELYYRNLNFQSVGNIYNEIRAGTRLSLTRALWSDYLIGSVNYTIENVGIQLNPGFHDARAIRVEGPGHDVNIYVDPANVPQTILNEVGYQLVSKVGFSLAYDTRNSTLLPDAGQRTELAVDFAGGPFGGDKTYYKAELKSGWYVRGFGKGHVLELAGRLGVAESLNSREVPFYDRFYLGGLYSLRGFSYRTISPREPGFTEPIGGDSYWFGTAEYSIPIIQKEKVGGVRLALFYDIGSVGAKAYDFNFQNYSDNWGIGMRLNLPIGPLRLDYGLPLHHDSFSSGSGRFQFGVGYTREF
jgi:outer membrane protein insertion porin family